MITGITQDSPAYTRLLQAQGALQLTRSSAAPESIALVVELGEHGNTTLDPVGFANGGGNKDVKNEIRGVTYGACNVTRKSTSMIVTRAVASSS